MKGPYFTFSNFLSISRLILVLPIALLLRKNNLSVNVTILFLCFLACLTDFFDGYIARKMNQVSDFGKLLDPLADKVAIVVVTFLLIHYRGFPMWLFIAILVRDLGIVFGSLFVIGKRKVIVQSNWTGKITVGILAATVIVHIAVIKPLIPISIGLSLAGLIISSLSYFKKFIEINREYQKSVPVHHAQKMS